MSRLGTYLQVELARRGLTPEEFGRRSGLGTSHIYQIIRGEKWNVRQRTIDRIAEGLHMTTADLLRNVSGQVEDDPLEREVRERTSEMREVLEGIPRPMWGAVLKATFDRATDSMRDITYLLNEQRAHRRTDKTPVQPTNTMPSKPPNMVIAADDDDLTSRQPVTTLLLAAS